MTATFSPGDPRRFVPRAVRRVPRSHVAATLTIDAVVLVADLVGFTPTVAALAAQGRHGNARLMALLDDSYAAIDACVDGHGGEVVQRIGDATVAVFEGSDADDVRARARAAAQQIAGLQAEHTERPASRVGLAAGHCDLLVVPFGPRSTWTLLGDATAKAATAQAKGTANTVVVDASVDAWAGSAAGDDVQRVSDDDVATLMPRALRTVDTGDEWIGEVRPLTTMFCRLTDAAGAPLSSGRAIGDALAALYHAFELTDCSVDQLSWDEKGLQTLSILGTGAERSPEHAALRAVDAALRATESSAAAGFVVTVGIATDTAVIGAWGGDGQRSFTAMGPAVNLSARLAGLTAGRVWVDEETARLAAHDIAFDREVRALKGVGEVTVCAARRTAAATTPGDDDRPSMVGTVVGRAAERRVLEDAVERAAAGGRGAVVVTGSPGVGKSTLLDGAVDVARSRGLEVVELRGDPVVGDAPLHAVGGLVRAHRTGPWPPTQWSMALGGPDRASTLALVQADVSAVLPATPFLLVVRQAHWADGASFEVLRAALHDSPPHALLVEHRDSALPAALTRLLEAEDASTVHLDGFGRDEVGELIARRLGLRAVPDMVVDRVHHHAAGNPFMVTQLVDSALASGEIELVGDLVRLRSAGDADAPLDVPTDVHRLVAGAIDALEPVPGLALKAAATIGPRFEAEDLRRIHPLAPTADALDVALVELEGRGLVRRDGDAFRFAHSITRDVAASLLTPMQRMSLHRATAELIETERADSDDAVVLLAHHWTEADDASRALPYLSAAALQTHVVFAGPQTARYVQTAQQLAQRHGVEVDALTRARWHIALGEAARTSGDIDTYRHEVREALAQLGLAVPDTAAGRARAIARALATQTRLRVRGTTSTPDPADRERADATLNLLRTMNITATEEDDLSLTLLVNLLSMNVAETGGLDDELTAGYGMAEVAARSMGMRRVADMYARLTDRVAVGAEPRIAAEVRVYHSIRKLGDGDVHDAARLLQEAHAIYDTLGTRYIADVVQAQQGYADYFSGDLEGAVLRYRDLSDDAARRGDPRMSGWGSNGEAMALLALGRDAEAQERLDAGDGLPSDVVSQLARRVAQGLLDARGPTSFADAERSVTAAATALVATPPSFYFLLCQYVFVAESLRLLRLRAVVEAPHRARALHRRHRQVLRRFGAFRAVFPVARPSYHAAVLDAERLGAPHALTDLRVRRAERALRRSLGRVSVGVFPHGSPSTSSPSETA